MLHALQGIPADQATVEFDERFMNVGATLEADTETPEVAQPGMLMLDDPACNLTMPWVENWPAAAVGRLD
jgi:hypothetical protein